MADISVKFPTAYRESTGNNIYVSGIDYVSGSNTYGFTPGVSSAMRLLKCDDSYYLVYSGSDASLHLQSSKSVTSTNSSRLGTVDSINWLKDNNFLSDDVYFNPAWTSYFLAIPVIDVISTNDSSYFYGTVDFRNPIFKDSPVVNSCSNYTTISISNGVNNVRLYNSYSYSVNDSGGDSGGGGSTDINSLIPAILMIPATIIVISFFSIIYRMFINRRIRG